VFGTGSTGRRGKDVTLVRTTGFLSTAPPLVDVTRLTMIQKFIVISLPSIKGIYAKIMANNFIAAGDTNKEETIKRFYERLDLLKNFQSPAYITASAEVYPTSSSTTTTEATQSLNP